MQELIEYKPQGELVYNPDFFRQNIKYSQFNSCEQTVSELLDSLDIPEHKKSYVRVSIGGRIVPREIWNYVKPKNTHVLVSVATRGGSGGGKGILRLVAIIAIAVFAPYLVTFMAPTLAGAGAALAIAGVTLAGTLLINAVFPPPSIGNQGRASNETSESPSLTLQGQRNVIAPGSPVIRVYGRRRIWPKNAATPFIQTRGDTQYLYMLLDFGYGDLVLQDEQIGETPLSQYNDLQYVVHRNVTDPVLKYFTKNIFTETLGIVLEQNIEHIRTSQLESKGVQIDFTFPGGLTNINDSGNRTIHEVGFSISYRKVGDIEFLSYTLASFSTSRRVTLLSSSPNRFPLNSNNQLPLQSPDIAGVTFDMSGEASTTFDETTLITIIGGNLDDHPDHVPQYPTDQKTGYRAGATQITINSANLITNTGYFILNGVTYSFVNGVPIGTSVVEISPPLQNDLITSAFEYVRPSAENALVSSQQINYTYGGYAYYERTLTMEVREATTEPFTVQLDLSFGEVAQWEIRIVRATPVSTSTRVVDTVVWSTLRSVRDTPSVFFDVPHTVVELKIKATDQLQGVVDTFSAIATSVLPSYISGVAQPPAPTRNPAWHAMDVLTGTSNPTPLPLSKIDIPKFEAWAAFCASINPTYAESNLLSDFVIDFNSTIFNILKTIMGFGRASLNPSDGKYSVIFDSQQTVPIQMFTSHNSSNFVSSKSLTTPPSAIKVSFVDPDSNWQPRDIIVDTSPVSVNGAFEDNSFDGGFDLSSGANTTQGIEYQKIALVGVTRQTQAWRDGRYFLAEAILREYTLSMDVDIENIVCERGDFVKIQQDVVRIGGLPGRIKTVVGDIITTTEPLDFQGVPANYRLQIRQTDNAIVEYIPVSQSDLNTITLPPGDYQVGDLYTWGFVDQVTGDFIVKEIMPKNDLKASITVIPLAPEIYGVDTGSIPPYVPSLSPDLFQPPPVLAEVSSSYYYEYPNRFPQITMIVSWAQNDAAVSESYEIYRYLDSRWKLIALTDLNSYNYYDDISIFNDEGVNILGEDHVFIVVPVGPTGLKHELDKHPQTNITPVPDTLTPPPPSDFDLDVVSTTIQLTWVPNNNVVADIKNPGIIGYVLRYNPQTIALGGSTWENSAFLTSANFDQTTATVHARIGSYFIKTINVWNLFSTTSLLAGTTIPFIEGILPVDSINESPLWLGLKIDMVIDGTDIVNEEIAPTVFAQLGFYEFDTQIDLGAIYTIRIDSFIIATGSSPEFMSDWSLLSVIPLLSPATEADWKVDMQVTSDDGVNWKTFISADVTGRIFRFRLMVRTFRDRTDVQVRVSNAQINLSLKEKLDSDNDVQCPVGGLSVLFDPALATVPSISVTQDNATAGDYFVRSNVLRTGFDIQFFDVNDVSVARQFDWMARGFGTEADAVIPP